MAETSVSTVLITDPLDYWGRCTPGDPALVFDGADGVTYGELSRWVDASAQDLLDRGASAGDRVALFGANSLEWCVAALAALKAGLTIVPFNIRLRNAELEHLVADSALTFVVADPEYAADLRTPTDVTWICTTEVRSLRSRLASVPRPAVPAGQPAVLVYTSGTTSQAKAVTYTHRSLLDYIFEQTLMVGGYRHGIRMLFALPLGGAPGVLALTLMTTHGGTLFLEPDLEPARTLARFTEQRIQAFWGVPAMYDKLAALPGFATADLSSLEVAMIGSTRIQQDVVDRWAAKGVVLRRHYGMTELGGSSTVATEQTARTRPESVGCGGVFTQHRIVRSEGTECAPGEPGEIEVCGPSVTPGYWRNEDATRSATRGAWFATGDTGWRDPDGHLYFVDRQKDIIVTAGGHNIAPAEIEALVAAIPGVDEVAVVAVAGDRGEDVPIVVLGPGSEPRTPEQVLDRCAQRLARYKLPRLVVVSPDPLPRNALGKLMKNRLKAGLPTVAAASALGTAAVRLSDASR